MYLVTGVSEERPDRQLMLEGGVEQRLLLQLLQLLRPHHVEGVGPQVRTVDKGGAQRFCNANRKLINYLFCKHFNYSIHGEKIQTKNSARSSFFTFLHIDLWKPTATFVTVDLYTSSCSSKYRPISELELAEAIWWVGDV